MFKNFILLAALIATVYGSYTLLENDPEKIRSEKLLADSKKHFKGKTFRVKGGKYQIKVEEQKDFENVAVYLYKQHLVREAIKVNPNLKQTAKEQVLKKYPDLTETPRQLTIAARNALEKLVLEQYFEGLSI